jgi:hypothetical protein
VAVFFHVSPAANRDSISRHGLDWRRGGGGIAGSLAPEQQGVFLARDRSEADFFIRMGDGRFAALDLWEVTFDNPGPGGVAVSESHFREFDGFLCWMAAIPPSWLRLAERDVIPAHTEPTTDDGSAMVTWFRVEPESDSATQHDRPANESDAIAFMVNHAPELRPLLDEHVATFGQLLPYVVFETDFTRWFVERIRAGDEDAPKRFAAAVETLMRTDADPPASDPVWNLGAVSFVEALQRHPDGPAVGLPWMGFNTLRAFHTIG